ncbi:ABC transporter substrate-binding protein [Hoeflea alexandrii]|uniref:ABC transporter substrate-binding protein n=1 Tax=Hoeflea alexandrii TaxID=288436 RepID=UPI0022AF0852|nr:sugar ABC transporter substrate-binding protein [Hoeflea alexandrii]MCZ4292000.1 sugar ABC transporter substrate-binding protein [Hoeflea alexandrii]
MAMMPLTSAKAQDGLGTADSPVEVRIMANEAFASTWQTMLVPEFNKVFPNVQVTFDGVPYAELLAKMMLDATSPEPEYDVLLVDDPWVPQLAEIGALADLKGEKVSALTDAGYDWDDFNAAPLAAGEWKGIQYAVPVRSNVLLRFYNRSLYKAAGLPEPTPAQTWDEFFSDAEKLVRDTNGDGNADVWAVDTYFVRDSLTPTIWQSILNANGGRLLDDSGAPAFADEVGAKSLETHKRLLDYAPPGALGHGFSDSLQAFRQGLVANLFNWGSVYKSTAVDPKSTTLTVDEVGIQVLPVGDVQAGTHRGIWIAGIGSKTKNLEASWAFLQWLSSKQGESINASLVGSFPARKSTLTGAPAEPWLGPVYAALQHAYEVAGDGGMWRIRSPKSDAAQQILADEVARGLASQASAEEALGVAAEKIAKALK